MAKNEKNNRTAHTNPKRGRMSDAELRDHLMESHGWSAAMYQQRGQWEQGDYPRSWHDNAHKTAYLDNPKGL